MRRIVFVVTCLAVLLVLVLPTLGLSLVHGEAMRQVRDTQAQVEADQRALAERVMADQRRWAEHPLFARRDGGDAAHLLDDTIGWDTPGPNALPPEVMAALRDAGSSWPQRSLDLTSLDLEWMRQLDALGFWDLETAGPLSRAPFDGLQDPTPNGIGLTMTARARLLQGLQTGELARARDEVRALARLLFTAETLITDMLGVSLLQSDRLAVEEAQRRGVDAGPLPVFSQEDAQSLRNALWVACHATSLVAPSTPLAPDFPRLGRCSALHEAGAALLLRPWLHDVVPERYAAIEALLEHSPECRLRRFRRAWAGDAGEGELAVTGDALCRVPFGGSSPTCTTPDALVRLPVVRRAVGATLLNIGAPNWLGRYASDAGTP